MEILKTGRDSSDETKDFAVFSLTFYKCWTVLVNMRNSLTFNERVDGSSPSGLLGAFLCLKYL